jgi:SHS2 domain-containing protein
VTNHFPAPVSVVTPMHELFDHTADLGLRATAPTANELFAEMGRALLAALVEEPATVRANTSARIEIAGTDREYLLFDWLKELLLRFETERVLFAEFDVTMTATGLVGEARGEVYDESRHALAHEVKAITYHELKVIEINGEWLAEAIVDI